MNTHLKKYSPLFKQEGVTRDERYSPALHPENSPIDDRKLKDLLLYIQQFSKHLLFIDADEEGTGNSGKVCRTWEDVLKTDPALLAANIAACPIPEIGQVFDLLQMQFDNDRSMITFFRLMEYVFSLFKRMDEWYHAVARSERETTLKRDLQSFIQSHLSKKLKDLLQIDGHARHLASGQDLTIAPPPALLNTDLVWGSLQGEDRLYGERIFIGKDDAEKLINAGLRLKEIFDTVFHVTGQVVDNCNSYLDETLHSKKDHQPHVALMITFLELFGYAQEEINRIPRKHLQYYYGQVLGLRARKAIADRAFVCFGLENGFGDYEIRRGTVLLAGKDRLNIDRRYVTEKDIVVNRARVAAVRTLFIEKDRHNQVLQYYTDPPVSADAGSEDGTTRSLFGDRNGLSGGSVGFAIASPQFFLTKGERMVTILLELEKEFPVSKFDPAVLELLLTGEKGWLSSDTEADGISIPVINRVADNMLELQFTVAISQPSAIIAFDRTLHTGDFNIDLPVLQLLLKYPLRPVSADPALLIAYQNQIIQLNSLQKLRPVQTTITVQVGNVDAAISFDGVRELALQNHEAVLDPAKPFYPFTSTPKVGSSFYIGCSDLFNKPLQRLTLNIEWMLPDRFRNYYDKYLPPYDSNKFKASLSILRKKKWQKINEISLIDTDSNDPRWRSVKIDPGKSADTRAGAQPENGIGRFDPSKKDGMLKLKLVYPDFGHSIYTQLVTAAVMEKAASHRPAPDFYKIVKTQLHDSVISIKLPPDMAARNGPFKVVIFEVAESPKTDEEARTMMIKGLSTLIRNFNGHLPRTGTMAATRPETAVTPEQQRTIVNDDNFIERVFGFLRRIKLLASDRHFDKDKQDLGDVVVNVKDRIETKANFILPADKELVGLIMEVTNSAIDQTVLKVVDAILASRASGITESRLTEVFKKEFDEANEIINDMIASKIATMLLTNEIPPPPYTPQINMISLSYLSSRPCNPEEDRFFRVNPFGVSAIGQGEDLFDGNFLRHPAGMLFVGIGDYLPGQNLSLLFRFAEGTGRTDKEPPPIAWLVLRDNAWETLPDECIVSDSTYGLQANGVLQLSLPRSGPDPDNLLGADGLRWVCATVNRDTDAFPCLVDIMTNAVPVVFVDHDNDPDHGALPLPVGSINRLADKVPAIKKVQQPLPSFHGKVAEQQTEFYTRVSERLRHKSRAVNNWDYERLVLDNFPEVYKVKCLNDYRDGRFARGHVTIVPLGDLRNKGNAGVNLLKPAVGYMLLRQIEELLKTMASPFVRIHAVNPQFSRVEINASVKFGQAEDKGYAMQKLEKDLIGLLTPWAAGNDGTLSFSTRIYASNVISFIDRLDYVDYVEDLEMRQYTEGDNGERIYVRNGAQSISLVETQFISGHAILISAPGHGIKLIS